MYFFEVIAYNNSNLTKKRNMNLTDYPVFSKVFDVISNTEIAHSMRKTIENSPWHREANTWVHTEMALQYYIDNIAPNRTYAQNMITLVALLAHDFGKPTAEETLEKKDGSGKYRSYAGHERISANVFISVMRDNPDIVGLLKSDCFDFDFFRTVKWMVENHLPYGLTRPEKLKALRKTLNATLGANEICFFDMLVSDANGRISDDHAAKLANVDAWIAGFKAIDVPATVKTALCAPTLYVLHGVSGAGKSTWRKALNAGRPKGKQALVACEDDWRIEYAIANMPKDQLEEMLMADEAEAYNMAWNFCSMNPDSKYPAYARKRFAEMLSWNLDIILDRTNQTRKNRASWIQPAREKGFRVHSVEFFISEAESAKRQETRGDKCVPHSAVQKICMNMETPWVGTEVDNFTVVWQS